MRRRPWLLLAPLGAILALAGASRLFSTFMMYDDEGYVLFSLQTFFNGGGLYERVYSQYGPFFYLFHQGLHALGLPFDNIGGRILTFFCWFGAATMCSASVWRVTRSAAAAFFTLGAVFMHLWPMVSEPSHPGGLITLFVAALAWLASYWVAEPRRLAVVTGLAGAALVLTKVNVGIFLVAGAAAWWGLHLDEPRLRLRWRTLVIAAAMALLPCALMRAQLGVGWVQTFALVTAAAGAAVVLAAAKGSRPLSHWRDAGTAAAVALTAAVLICVGIMLEGTSARGLLDGVLLGPLRHPQVYSAAIRWRPGVDVLAVLSLATAVWFVVQPPRVAPLVVAGGRLLATAFFVTGWMWDWPLGTHAFALSYAVTATWFFVFPLPGEESSQPLRAWLALLVATQVLHAFPVAGSQISWGTFLWIPLAAIGCCGALRHLASRWPAVGLPTLAAGAALVMAGTTVRATQYAWGGLRQLRDADTLGLPGAESLRLPESFTTMARVLARNASAHADVLFSLPGLHSFHLWTDVPPPTSINATHWFTLLSPAQQEAIRARLETSPRSCVIVQRNLYDFLRTSGVTTESPLTVWLRQNYEPAFALETYEFWVRKDRQIAALGTFQAREAAAGVSPRYQLTILLAEPALRDVTGIEFSRFANDTSTVITRWTRENAQVFVTPIRSNGAEAGPTRSVTFPFAAEGLVRLELRTNEMPSPFPRDAVLYLRNSAGEKVGEARLVQ